MGCSCGTFYIRVIFQKAADEMVHTDVRLDQTWKIIKNMKIFTKYLKLYENLAEMMEMDD